MIQLYLGHGKGKTTAAVGQAIRNLGRNGKVIFAQFLKSGETGEKFILEKLEGMTFITGITRHKGFIWNMNEQELNDTREDLQKGFLDIVRLVIEGSYTLVVLDEVLDAVECGFLDEELLLELFDNAPDTEFVLTGRNASERLAERADYITDMNKIKHPFDSGKKARKGIEY